jgi:hypothetical protein
LSAATFDRLSFALALACLVALVFLPLWLIYLYQLDTVQVAGRPSGEAAVGIAVVLRATVRRWLRTGSRNLLRTTLGTYSRASARTLTRRVVKSTTRILMGLLVKSSTEVADRHGGAAFDSPRRSVVGLLVGFLALCFSFWGVLLLQSHHDLMTITQSGQISVWVASLLAGAPLLVYAAAVLLAGRIWGVRVRYQTALDGLLLQGYFTGAGSFLPMTTDVEYEGRAESKHRVAAVALGTLYLMHLVLSAAANWTGSSLPLFAATMFLTYAFVYSFPIPPYEGYYLWSRSRMLWLGFWIPIVLSFIYCLPDSFATLF